MSPDTLIVSANSLSDNKSHLLEDAATGYCNVTANSKAAMSKHYICNACDVIYDRIYTCNNACSLCTATPPCTKFQLMYYNKCNRSFLSDKYYQLRLTVRVKRKLFCECRPVCRNCSLLWLQILSLNVSRHSAITITISSNQSVFATSLRSSLASFQIYLCTFCLIRNERNTLNSVRDISNSIELYMCSANVSTCEAIEELNINLHVWQTCPRVLAGPRREIYWLPLAVQNILG